MKDEVAVDGFASATIFRFKRWVIAICAIAGLVWVVLLVLYAGFLVSRKQVEWPLSPNGFRGVFLCAIGLPIGVWLIVMPFTYKLMLKTDWIEERYFLIPRLQLTRAEIAGKRVYPTGKHLAVCIYPVDRKRRPMVFSTGQLRNAKPIEDWISSLPAIDLPHKEWPTVPPWLKYAFWAFFGIPLLYDLVVVLFLKMGFWRHM